MAVKKKRPQDDAGILAAGKFAGVSANLLPEGLGRRERDSMDAGAQVLNMRGFVVGLVMRLARPVFMEEKLPWILGRDVQVIVEAARFLARGRDQANQGFLQFRLLA